MTSNQKLSSLVIAAAALLAASVPCFAQAQSADSRDESTPAAVTGVERTVALTRERATAESLPTYEGITPKSNNVVSARSSQPSLSMAMFKQSASQFSAGESQRFIAPQTTIYDRVDNSKRQFRVDDYDGPAPRPRVSFIPSRGPKLPD